jgi:hypothetical protein
MRRATICDTDSLKIIRREVTPSLKEKANEREVQYLVEGGESSLKVLESELLYSLCERFLPIREV